jgi:hypothetical protein
MRQVGRRRTSAPAPCGPGCARWPLPRCQLSSEALLALEVVFDPELLAGSVLPHVRAAGVRIHVAPGAPRRSSGKLPGEPTRGKRPEIPLHIVAADAGAGEAQLRVDEVGELHRVA